MMLKDKRGFVPFLVIGAVLFIVGFVVAILMAKGIIPFGSSLICSP